MESMESPSVEDVFDDMMDDFGGDDGGDDGGGDGGGERKLKSGEELDCFEAKINFFSDYVRRFQHP